jgi:8-oxo-dGTP diphosphatase
VSEGTAPVRWIDVAAAVIEREDGEFLLAQRPPGKVYEGWWEFPGGKVEAGEPVADALARELREELGIEVRLAYPWITRTYVYPHGNVRLHFYRVVDWEGQPQSREGQAFAWQRMPGLTVSPVLPANGPILGALALPLLLGITPADIPDEAAFLHSLDDALKGGLRFVQIRVPALAADRCRALSESVSARVHPMGGRVVANRGNAWTSETDGIHLRAVDLMALDARPPGDLVGASCHGLEELDQAERLGLDYAVLGPVLETASHPGQAGMGWQRFRELAAGRSFPVYAIGGLSAKDLPQARTAGAHGIAAIRSVWSARD